MQYLVISFIGDIYLKCLRTLVGCEFENAFFTILPGHILYMEYPFWHSYGRTYKVHLSSKHKRKETVLHLNNGMNVLLKLKENSTPKYAFS